MLFTLYRQYLKSDGVADEQIVSIIYNELRSRGYAVDVGVVESQERVGEKRQRITRENDFVTNAEIPGERYYIQSALSTEEPEKMEQEIRPFLKLQNDFTKRIVITKSDMEPWTDQYGIHHLGVYDFLLSKDLPFHRHSLTLT